MNACWSSDQVAESGLLPSAFMAFISWNSLWALPLMVPGEDAAEASGNRLLYTAPMCFAGTASLGISGNTPREHLAIPAPPAMAVLGAWSRGWRCVQWVLGSLSTGRPLSILPQTEGAPPCFPICQAEMIIASCLLGWAVRRGDRASLEGCSGWKVLRQHQCRAEAEDSGHQGEHLLHRRLSGESGDQLGSGDVIH